MAALIQRQSKQAAKQPTPQRGPGRTRRTHHQSPNPHIDTDVAEARSSHRYARLDQLLVHARGALGDGRQPTDYGLVFQTCRAVLTASFDASGELSGTEASMLRVELERVIGGVLDRKTQLQDQQSGVIHFAGHLAILTGCLGDLRKADCNLDDTTRKAGLSR